MDRHEGRRTTILRAFPTETGDLVVLVHLVVEEGLELDLLLHVLLFLRTDELLLLPFLRTSEEGQVAVDRDQVLETGTGVEELPVADEALLLGRDSGPVSDDGTELRDGGRLHSDGGASRSADEDLHHGFSCPGREERKSGRAREGME